MQLWARDPGAMTGSVLLDAAGRPRSPATMPDFRRGCPPRNKGRSYPADPPTVEEIVAVMRCAGEQACGLRTRALIVLLWRAGLRISEAVALAETDLDPVRGRVVVRRGKGGRRREVGMDVWAWEHVSAWLKARVELPVGALLCVISGPTAGRLWSATAARATLRRLTVQAGVRRRFAPHQLRHAHVVEMAREGVPLVDIQRQGVARLAEAKRQGQLEAELKRLSYVPLLLLDLCRYRDYADIVIAAGLNAVRCLGSPAMTPASLSA